MKIIQNGTGAQLEAARNGCNAEEGRAGDYVIKLFYPSPTERQNGIEATANRALDGSTYTS